MHTADDILKFWFVDHGREHWFGGGPDFDAELTAKFADTHAAVARGEAWTWRATPHGRLAEIIVLDQFSRQIHRGTARAFAQDQMALALAQEAVYAGLDQPLTPMPERMFLYMPFQHSESLVIHEEAMRLFTSLGSDEILAYEVAHRDLLRRFGRYPRRNEPLGRTSTPEEIEYCNSDEGPLVMDHFIPLFAILGALLLGAISPGPSFVFVVRTAVAQSRREGLAAALGMGVGAMLYGALAVLGLRTLMQDGGLFFTALKIAGGLYLVYLAWKIWSHAAEPITVNTGAGAVARPGKAFTLGLFTQLSNPKIVAVFGAVFAALLPANPEPWLYWALPPLIFLQETAWYAVVALAFSASRPRALYLSAKVWVDRAAAAFIGILGIRLIVEAR